MRMILDKKLLARLNFGERPVIENGELVRFEPNMSGSPFIILDAHPMAPRGFGVRVSKGCRTFVLRIRFEKRVVTTTVGRYPDLWVGSGVAPEKDARLIAGDLSRRLRCGEDVNAKRRAARKSKPDKTLGQLFDEYVEDYKQNLKRRIRPNTLRAIEKSKSRLGGTLLEKLAREVTWKDLGEFFQQKAGAAGHQTAAEQTIRWVSAVYNKANSLIALNALQHDVEPELYKNPAALFSKTGRIRTRVELERDYAKRGVRNPLTSSSDNFRRALDFVLAARMRPSARTAADYFLLTLILGTRRSESLALKWFDRLGDEDRTADNYVDLDARRICFNNTKNDHQLLLPIPDFLLELLVERRSLVGKSPFVFPAVSRSRLRATAHYNDSGSFLASVKKASGGDFTLHDLRRTFASVVNAMALPSLLVKQLLNHHSGDVTELYAKLTHEQLLPHMNDIEATILNYATTSPRRADTRTQP